MTEKDTGCTCDGHPAHPDVKKGHLPGCPHFPSVAIPAFDPSLPMETVFLTITFDNKHVHNVADGSWFAGCGRRSTFDELKSFLSTKFGVGNYLIVLELGGKKRQRHCHAIVEFHSNGTPKHRSENYF